MLLPLWHLCSSALIELCMSVAPRTESLSTAQLTSVRQPSVCDVLFCFLLSAEYFLQRLTLALPTPPLCGSVRALQSPGQPLGMGNGCAGAAQQSVLLLRCVTKRLIRVGQVCRAAFLSSSGWLHRVSQIQYSCCKTHNPTSCICELHVNSLRGLSKHG